MFPDSHFCVKSDFELLKKGRLVAFATPVSHVFCITWLLSRLLSIKSAIKNPLRKVTLLLHSNKTNSLSAEQAFYSVELETYLELSE